MGKSTISMAIFNSFLYVHQRVLKNHLWVGRLFFWIFLGQLYLQGGVPPVMFVGFRNHSNSLIRYIYHIPNTQWTSLHHLNSIWALAYGAPPYALFIFIPIIDVELESHIKSPSNHQSIPWIVRFSMERWSISQRHVSGVSTGGASWECPESSRRASGPSGAVWKSLETAVFFGGFFMGRYQENRCL